MKYIKLLLALLWHLAVDAQHAATLEGKIFSAVGEPLELVHVQLKETNFATVTGTDGSFLISDIPPGSYRLIVSALGFQQVEKNIKIIAGRKNEMFIQLHAIDTRLQEVVVTGTMKEVAHSNSPIPVDIVTPKLFQKNPTSSIFESLQLVNGVQPQINCNVCGAGDIHINGMEGAYTMVTIDGMPIVSALSTVYGLMGIPNSLVQRIEIVKGPASTLFGAEAMAGVINIITKNPVSAPLFSADYFVTTPGEMNLDLGFKTKIGRAHTLLGTHVFWFGNRLDVNDDNFTDVPLQKRVSVFNKWHFMRKDQKQTAVAARWFYENRWGGQLQWMPQWRGTDSIYGESIFTDRIEVIGQYDLPSKENIRLQYSYNYHHQNAAYGTVSFVATQHIAFAQLVWNKKAGRRNDLLAGIPFRYQFYDDNTPATASFESQQIRNRPQHIILPGAFIQDEILLHDKCTSLLGVRYDYNNLHGSIFSPRISFKYQPNHHNTLRLSGGNGYRVVHLFTEDHAALTGSRHVVIKEELKPERSWNINFNYNRFFFFKNGFGSVDANVFYTYFTNKIVGDFMTNSDLIIYSNLQGHAVSRGGNMQVDMSISNGFKYTIGFTIADVFQQTKDTAGTFVTSPQLHNSLFSATFMFSYNWQRPKLLFDFSGRIHSPMHLPVLEHDFRPDTSPWFALLNVQITKSFKFGMEIYGGIKNILNFIPKYPLMRPFDPFDKQVDDAVNNPYGYTFDTTYNYAPLQGIRGFFGIRYLLK